MQIAVGILVAVLVFGLMIFLHELGHYLAARIFKVKVIEFAVGMGPKIFSRTSKKTGIVYSLRAFPIGGFTAMQGEDGEDPDPDALVNHPRWQRLIVLFAGGFVNILTGVIATFLYLLMTETIGTTVIHSAMQNNVSFDAGLMPRDEIVSIEGHRMVSDTDIINTITLDGTKPLDIEVIRDGEKILIEDVVFPSETDEKSGLEIGVLDFYIVGVRPTLPVILRQTVRESVATVKVIYKTLFELVTGKYGMKAVSGPIGTVSVISEAASYGLSSVLYLYAFISINLGIMNLLPLPALDGGRILFVIIECIRRKPLKPEVEGYIHTAGMLLLFGLMIVVAVYDVAKLF